MAASEPVAERIAVKLQETLAAIVSDAGVTYWYTPGVVIRCDYFEDAPPNSAYDVIYQLRPEDRTRRSVATGASYERSATWLLTLAAKDLRPTSDPYREDSSQPLPETVKARLLADAQTAFGSQPWTAWAGLGVHSVVIAAETLVGGETAWEGWHVANAQIQVAWRERHV